MKPSAKLLDMPDVLVVRKPINLGGTKFKVGDTFDWKAAKLTERRVKQMWEQRWVGTAAELQHDRERWEAKKTAEQSAMASRIKEKAVVLPVKGKAPELETADDLGL